MTQRSSIHVVPVDYFYEPANDVWNEAYKQASRDMVEPLQVMSYLGFCKQVDADGNPVGNCRLAEAKYAVLTLTVRDLSEPIDSEWEPLCNRQRTVLQ